MNQIPHRAPTVELHAALFEAARRPDRAAAVRSELERLRRADTREA